VYAIVALHAGVLPALQDVFISVAKKGFGGFAMLKLAKTLAVLGLVLAVGSVASAATITYSSTIDYSKTDWVNTLNLQQFNTSLGHLNSVTLDFSTDIRTNIIVTNDATSGSYGDAQTKVVAKVKDRGGYISKTLTTISDTGDDDIVFHYDLASGGTVTSDTRYGSASTHNVYTNSNILTEFTKIGSGTGYVVMDANTFTQTLLANTGGNTAADQVTDARVSATVTYDYTVPEPSTMCLLGVGAILGMLRRRRKAVVTK